MTTPGKSCIPTSMEIPHSLPWIADSAQTAIAELVKNRMLSSAGAAQVFRVALSEHLQCISSNLLLAPSGTHALFTALRLLRDKGATSIAVPTFACPDLLIAIRWAGMQPIVLDVNEHLALDPQALSRHVQLAGIPSAIIVVHPFGQVIDLKPYTNWNVPIIEDCAHRVQPPSPLAAMSIFSFQATKWLPVGEAGACYLRDTEDANTAATNFPEKIPDITATIGLQQLKVLPSMEQRRQELWEEYRAALGTGEGFEHFLYLPEALPFRLLLQLKDRGKVRDFQTLQSAMLDAGIHVRRPVSPLIHQALQLRAADFPVAELLFQRLVSLPFYPSLTSAQLQHVAQNFRRIVG